MEEMPIWIKDLMDKGTSVKECIELWKEIKETEREEHERRLERDKLMADRDERIAERNAKREALEHEVKLRELAIREQKLLY